MKKVISEKYNILQILFEKGRYESNHYDFYVDIKYIINGFYENTIKIYFNKYGKLHTYRQVAKIHNLPPVNNDSTIDTIMLAKKIEE